MAIEKTIDRGEHRIEIDHWGGVHIHYPDDHERPLSYSPEMMRKIEQARYEVMNGGDE